MTSAESAEKTSLAKVAAATFVGNLIEMYDWILYPFIAAQVFGEVFFPDVTPWIGTMAAIATQAIAFAVRPLGALLCGWLGDRFGRRPGLIATLIGMGAATLLVGLLPGYSTIGVAAPVLLIVFRLVQGLAVGGEWGGSILMAVEHAPLRRKTLFGSIPQIGSTMGMGCAAVSVALVSTVMDHDTFVSWGWRIPFLASAVLILVGIVIRLGVSETPEFERQSGENKSVREGVAPLLASILTWMAATIAVLLFAIQLVSYAPDAVDGIRAFDVEIGMFFASVLQIPVMLVGAKLGTRYGHVWVLVAAGVIAAAWAVPGYMLIVSGSATLLAVSMVVGLIPYGLTGAVMGALASARFPVWLRFRGLGLGFACATVIGGGLLPIPILLWVRALDNSYMPLALASIVGGICTVIGALWLNKLPAYGPVLPVGARSMRAPVSGGAVAV